MSAGRSPSSKVGCPNQLCEQNRNTLHSRSLDSSVKEAGENLLIAKKLTLKYQQHKGTKSAAFRILRTQASFSAFKPLSRCVHQCWQLLRGKKFLAVILISPCNNNLYLHIYVFIILRFYPNSGGRGSLHHIYLNFKYWFLGIKQ